MINCVWKSDQSHCTVGICHVDVCTCFFCLFSIVFFFFLVQNDSQACHNPDQIQEANSTASTTTNLSTRKRPFPSVTTSDAWMNIYETEERKKQLQEELKKQRIEERKAKKSRKRNKKKKIKTQKTGPVRRKKQSQKPKK